MDIENILAHIAAIFASLAAFVAALIGAVKTYEDVRLTKTLARDVNGRLEQLLEKVRREAYASGYTDGVKLADERAKSANPPKPEK